MDRMIAESSDGRRRKSVIVSAKIRPRLGVKSDAGAAPNIGDGAPAVGATGAGVRVCAETVGGMAIQTEKEVATIRAYTGCLMNQPTGSDTSQRQIRHGSEVKHSDRVTSW
jgi:hypothetical protein